MKAKDKIIWNNIEALLDEKSWTYAVLAKKAKTRTQTINSIKHGDRGIGPTLII
jgi:hypothetical protein